MPTQRNMLHLCAKSRIKNVIYDNVDEQFVSIYSDRNLPIKYRVGREYYIRQLERQHSKKVTESKQLSFPTKQLQLAR